MERMKMSIAVSSGKGGTGKTFVATNIARILEKAGENMTYLDCDVEEPNGHLFLKPVMKEETPVTLMSPAAVDPARCTLCGKCAAACRYHAIACVKESVLFFRNLCHVCGACELVCPKNAILLEKRPIGNLKRGMSGGIECVWGLLETGEGSMTPRLIRRVKECAGPGITILDSPPGTSCPVVETVKDADLVALVTDPTPFGINDLKLAVAMCRELDREPVVVVNRAEYLDDELKKWCREEELEIVGEIPEERKIAECYSRGDLAVECFPEYAELFEQIAERMMKRAREKRPVRKNKKTGAALDANPPNMESHTERVGEHPPAGGELVVISGKGGTGKTSIAACFCALEKKIAIADCDVDAADLHLVLKPRIRERGAFSGGEIAVIKEEKCTGCRACETACRFSAIYSEVRAGKTVCRVNPKSCEGCGVCGIVCAFDAVSFAPAVNGEWFASETPYGPMSHAKLGVAEENSGKLVSFIRKKKNEAASRDDLGLSVCDGSPGTGCPVIASISGTDYALIVTEPTVSGVHDLDRILAVVKHFGVASGVVVNKYDLNPQKTDEIRELSKSRGVDIVGLVPYDKDFTRAQMKGVPVVEYSDGALSAVIREIWEKVKAVLNRGVRV